MQIKLLCLEVRAEPESKEDHAPVYYVARFKRVAATTEERQKLAQACPVARLELGTRDPKQYRVGREYDLVVSLSCDARETLGERIETAASLEDLKAIEVELNQTSMPKADRESLLAELSAARKRLAA